MYEMGMYAWYGNGVVCAWDGNLCMVWEWGGVCMGRECMHGMRIRGVCMGSECMYGVGIYVPMYVWVHSKAVMKEGREVEA
jgi:hypothetical protein